MAFGYTNKEKKNTNKWPTKCDASQIILIFFFTYQFLHLFYTYFYFSVHNNYHIYCKPSNNIFDSSR